MAGQTAREPGCRQEAGEIAKARVEQVVHPATGLEHRQLKESEADVGHTRQHGGAGTAHQGGEQQGRHLQGDRQRDQAESSGPKAGKSRLHQAATHDQQEAGEGTAPVGEGSHEGPVAGPILQESGGLASDCVAMTDPASPALPFAVGSRVRLRELPAYLKSADPMPMLRPPDLVDAQEEGEVVGLRALEQLAVRFRRGTFLLEARQLEAVSP